MWPKNGMASYITPATWGFPNASKRRTESKVAHEHPTCARATSDVRNRDFDLMSEVSFHFSSADLYKVFFLPIL